MFVIFEEKTKINMFRFVSKAAKKQEEVVLCCGCVWFLLVSVIICWYLVDYAEYITNNANSCFSHDNDLKHTAHFVFGYFITAHMWWNSNAAPDKNVW